MWSDMLCNPIGRKRFSSILLTVMLNLLLVVFLIYAHLSFYAEAHSRTHATSQSPSVSVVAQQDSPLLVTVGMVDASDPLSPQITYAARNISNKPIRAFTVLEEAATKSTRIKGSTIINIMSAAKILQPGQIEQNTFTGHRFGEPLLTLTLSTDFVEFADGATWGKDTQQSAENLAGQRAGGRETIKKLRELMMTQGNVDVANLVKGEKVEIVAPPSGHSEAWRYGFQTGHNVVLRRLRVAYEKGGSRNLVSELQKQFDASEGRQ
jgi:flagellar basal body-associated protein FliL